MQELQDIEPFISLGMRTVPINSTIDHNRDEAGVITKGKKFRPPKSWDKYKHDINEIATGAGAIITGPDSIVNPETGELTGILVIDCDSPTIYKMVKSLDPTYTAVAESQPDKGGSFFYLEESILPTINNGPFKLEIFNGGSARMVFLPTSSNKTKKPWHQDSDGNMYNHNKEPISLRPMPKQLRDYLSEWVTEATKAIQKPQVGTATSANMPNWSPLVEEAIKSKEFHPMFFRILTPKSFRDAQQYIDENTLHPNNVPDGMGSNYLASIALILASDKSISPELFTQAIQYINSLWDEPFTSKRLDSTIINPKLKSKYWVYDKDWQKSVFVFSSKLEEQVEYIASNNENTYTEINYTNQTLQTYTSPNELKNRWITALGFSTKRASAMLPSIPLLYTRVEPHLPFGRQDNNKDFNMFIQSPSLRTLNDPTSYSSSYSYPSDFVEYITQWIPDDSDREYFLRFWLTKLTTFEYSAVVFLIVGIQGSGKGTFVKVLEKIIGAPYIEKEAGKDHAIDKYTAWMYNKFVVVFEELAGQLNRSEAKMVTEKIKGWSGSTTFSLRAMRMDHVTVPQRATFILNQNVEQYEFSEEDRRMMVVDTPNKMDGKLAERLYTSIEQESYMMDICYYIATEYDVLPYTQYRDAPMTERKMNRIISKMPISTKLVAFISSGNYSDLLDFCAEFATVDAILKLFSHRTKGWMLINDLVSIYMQHPNAVMEEEAARLAFLDIVKEKKFELARTSMDEQGHKVSVYKFIIDDLRYAPLAKRIEELTSPGDVSDGKDDGLAL